ncbi:transcription antitermination protein NusB [Gammaproteobacteria bacterium]
MKPHARHKARALALQAIFQWQYAANSVGDVETQYLAELNPKKVDAEYFSDLLRSTIKNIEAIDAIITPALDRKMKELNQVECAVLRLAVYELLYRLDVPYKVIINEALELEKKFGTVEGYKYVNGVLDKIAHSSRLTTEVKKTMFKKIFLL